MQGEISTDLGSIVYIQDIYAKIRYINHRSDSVFIDNDYIKFIDISYVFKEALLPPKFRQCLIPCVPPKFKNIKKVIYFERLR